MKKLFLCLLTSTLCLTFSGCSNNSELEALKKENEELKAALAGNTSTTTSISETPQSSKPSASDDFSQYDLLAFSLSKSDRTSYSEEVIDTYTVTNNSEYVLKKVVIDVVYYDANNNILCKDSRFTDVALSPGQSIDIKSYSHVDGDKDKVNNSAVVSYNYTTVDNTPSGYNYFDVNLLTKEVDCRAKN